MKVRRTHYELAFQAYLDRRGTPYVAVEDVRHFVKGRTGIKVFDYIVYPAGVRPQLVDVKGRKSAGVAADGESRQKTWVTRADLTGLSEWQGIFGAEYDAAFVFSYWLADAKRPDASDSPVLFDETFRFAGRAYQFWVVGLADYQEHQKRLSVRWDTVSVARDTFRRIAKPLEAMWPAAPC